MDYKVILSEEDWGRIANFLDPEKDDSRLHPEPIENLGAKIQEQVLTQKFGENSYDSNESKFEVFDGKNPAKFSYGNAKELGWDNNVFTSYYDALVYARKWLGETCGGSRDGLTGVEIKIGIPHQYGGTNDTIEIRETINV